MSISVHEWNLNERLGYVSGTRISETEINLHLGVKRKDGSIEKVGRFHLPLLSLHGNGFVTRRNTPDNRTFTVKIFLAADGTYSIGTQKNKTTPLEQFRQTST